MWHGTTLTRKHPSRRRIEAGVHRTARRLASDKRLGMSFQEARIVDEILRKALGHMHGGHIPEALVTILRGRLSYFTHPICRALGRQCEAHPTEHHHDAA